MEPDELLQEGVYCKDKAMAIILFSLAIYLRKDFLLALYCRALLYFEIGQFNLALMDITRCHDLDLDNSYFYVKWEKLLNNLVQQEIDHDSDN